jgi:signal transduction histidine kinase
MRQLFQNLIGNALKFHKKDQPPVVTVSSHETVDGYRIEVSDNGIGFEEKYLDRIFAVFQRLQGRDEYEGTGIGLAVCRKIVERHGGQITARSQPGEGTTFIVSLPKLDHKKGEEI